MSSIAIRRTDSKTGRFIKSDPTYDLAYAILSSRKPNQGRQADLELASVVCRVIGADISPLYDAGARIHFEVYQGGPIFPQEFGPAAHVGHNFGPASARPTFGDFYGIRKGDRLYTLGAV